MKFAMFAVLLAALGSVGRIFAEDAAMSPNAVPSTQPGVPDVLNFQMKMLDGKMADLGNYKGKVILMVNTASKCGNTPQYAPLEALYDKYKDKGFVILGFPSNDFVAQEPGTDADISTFCTTHYGVTFDMFSKVDVKGPDITPLYKYLITHAPAKYVGNPAPAGGDVKWNFEKFLISRDGKIVARVWNKTSPDTPEVISAIEAEIAK